MWGQEVLRRYLTRKKSSAVGGLVKRDNGGAMAAASTLVSGHDVALV